MFCSNFVFTTFPLIFFSLFEIVGNDILKIYELPKIDNKITKYSQIFIWAIIIYQASSMS